MQETISLPLTRWKKTGSKLRTIDQEARNVGGVQSWTRRCWRTKWEWLHLSKPPQAPYSSLSGTVWLGRKGLHSRKQPQGRCPGRKNQEASSRPGRQKCWWSRAGPDITGGQKGHGYVFQSPPCSFLKPIRDSQAEEERVPLQETAPWSLARWSKPRSKLRAGPEALLDAA